MKIFRNVTVLGLTLFGLTSCEGVQDFLGFTRETPDEFAVVERAPLEIPPDFTIRPPLPGAKRPQTEEAPAKAKKHVLSHVTADQLIQKAPHPISNKAERKLLDQARTAQHAPDIKHTLYKDQQEESTEEETLMQKLALSNKAALQGDVIDPIAETDRLNSEHNYTTE